MPGIAGIVAHTFGEAQRAMLHQMVSCMEYESFFESGTYVHEAMGLGVGWTSHKGGFASCLPIWNESRDVCLLFTGEHFGEHRREVTALRARGHRVDAPNAEYLVHLYEERGLDGFLRQLNGWFSGVLVDLRRSTAVLFNDRYGLKRIYCHESREAFYFASEAKSLLKVLPRLRSFDPRGLGEFFSCGCVLQNRSLFDGITLLPGGSKWTFSLAAAVAKASYFLPETWGHQPRLTAEAYYEELKQTFARILPRYFDGSERVGISLTGGVDSRMVMAWTRPAAGALPCYTFGGVYRDCTDVKVARRVARLSGQPHDVITIGDDFLSEFPALAEKTVYVSDGTMDVSGSPDLYVNRVARDIAPVRVTGNYGGEILRSIVAFKPLPLPESMFAPDFARDVRTGAATYRQEAQGRVLSFVAFKQVPWHHYSRLNLEQSQLTLRSPYLDNDLVSLVFRAPEHLATSQEVCLRLIHDGNPALGRIGTDRSARFRPVPVVTPLMHRYQNFTFRAEYAYDYGMPHWLVRLDNILRPLHPERLFLGRHKFHHFRIWYRDRLAGYLRDVLLDRRTLARPHLCGRRIEEMVRNHTSGRENHTSAIHRLLTIELAQRHLIEPR
jgi:asparagine synthase (glutamine-hydrolysing)